MSGSCDLAISILNADWSNLPAEMGKVSNSANFIHLDIMDGEFVPATTFTFDQAAQIISQSPLPVDVHLMVKDVQSWVEVVSQAGAHSATFHFEALANAAEVTRQLARISATGLKAGLGIKPATSVLAITGHLAAIDLALVMTVEPGAGGQSFMPEQLQKVSLLRDLALENRYSYVIQVDGGINLETFASAAGVGATNFVIGSAVYRAPNPDEFLQQIRQIWEMLNSSAN